MLALHLRRLQLGAVMQLHPPRNCRCCRQVVVNESQRLPGPNQTAPTPQWPANPCPALASSTTAVMAAVTAGRCHYGRIRLPAWRNTRKVLCSLLPVLDTGLHRAQSGRALCDHLWWGRGLRHHHTRAALQPTLPRPCFSSSSTGGSAERPAADAGRSSSSVRSSSWWWGWAQPGAAAWQLHRQRRKPVGRRRSGRV